MRKDICKILQIYCRWKNVNQMKYLTAFSNSMELQIYQNSYLNYSKHFLEHKQRMVFEEP